ncbi:MAG TPA: cysteine--tRNA ligase [Candidatus Omnitrophota bacterium]|nr:cysteine--tRNA ligase [Candidatus Omnitrophota bacterium]
MALKIYNTLKRKEEEFKPLKAGKVTMYVCGPTVYDVLHVGNFRGAVFFNLVRNWLEHGGYKANFAYNYTDIDDKIINRANQEGKSAQEISAMYIREYERDFKALKLRAHDHNPRATDYIQQMIEVIKTLIDKKKAYVIGGEVFYSVDSFKEYGKLSHKNLDELQIGQRVEVDPRKKNPLDFVLWKPSKENEPSWDSPWGRGRPGWHIECSVMAKTLLGDTIDIHGGGIDLIFPHHENEVAQSEGATDKPFVRYWMHNNFVNFGDTKMSKSLGNVVTAREFLNKYNAEIFKYMMLSVHYRSPLSLADAQIQQAVAALARIYSALAAAESLIGADVKEGSLDSSFVKALKESTQQLEEAMDDDFNTPAVFAKIFDVVRAFNALLLKNPKPNPSMKAVAKAFKDWILPYGAMMSLFQESFQEFLRKLDGMLLKQKGLDVKEIEKKFNERNQARAGKDFSKADQLRQELAELGIEIQDALGGSSWQVKKG